MQRKPPENAVCGKQPLECAQAGMANASSECISLLIRLCFDRNEAVTLLSSLSEEQAVELLRIGVVYKKLARLAHEDGVAQRKVENAIAFKLSGVTPGLENQPLCDLAAIWARRRDEIDALSAAALLWHVARSPLPCWRRLETHIIEDIQYLCVRALGRPSNSDLGTCAPLAGGFSG